MPSSRHHSFGDSAGSWEEIARFFRQVAESHEKLRPMAVLAEKIAGSDFATGGLHGQTSMHDLCISQSRDIFGNPHLRIHLNVGNQQFEFFYEDGSLTPWSRVCDHSEGFDVLERFLTKRARWFRPAVTKNMSNVRRLSDPDDESARQRLK